jgi:tetratricopeptide (TPR) repeat protein
MVLSNEKTVIFYFVLTVFFLPFFALCAFTGCASVKRMYVNPLDAQAADGEYSRVEQAVTTEKNQYQKDKNEISFYLDRGMAAHYGGNYQQSSRDLEEAERLIEEAFTKDISDSVAAFVKGDVKKAQYSGEDFENIYINVFNALNYYHAGNREDAIVEIRRSNEKLEYITGEYAAQSETWKAKLENFAGIPPELNFSNSALARYVSVLFYRDAGRLDDARIDAQEAAGAFAAYPEVYHFPLPPFLALGPDRTCAETKIPAEKARLNLLAFTGLSPLKVKPLDNYFWYRLNKPLYGGRILRGPPRNLPREKKVQVDMLTLKPILAAFAAFCSKGDTAYHYSGAVFTLAFMLDDLYVNGGIDAALQDILKVWDTKDYSRAGENAFALAEKLYGTGMREYGSEIMEKMSGINGLTKRFTTDELGLRIQSRESPVTRIEAVIYGQGMFTLELLEDMGKAVDLLYRRRAVRNNAASAYDLTINFLEKGKTEISGVPVVNLVGGLTLGTAEMAAVYGKFLFKDTPALFVSTLGMLRSAVLGIFFIPTKGIEDAEIAYQVNKELGRFDDRMGRFLPDKAYAGGINLDPGIYGITVNYYNGGTLLRSERHENVRVETGCLNLIESFFLGNAG